MASFYIDPATGAASFAGNITTANQVQFRNRVINGDMRVDQRGGQGTVGSGAGSSTSTLSTTYGLDRWAIATGPASGTAAAAQVALSAADQAAVGGIFTNAASIGVVPTDSLGVYCPFDGSVADISGNGNTPTVTGSVSYIPGRVGSNAVYLANEANVLSTSTAAANYIINSSYVYAPSFTVSLWVLYTKTPLSLSYPSSVFSTTTSGSGNQSLYIYIRNNNTIAFGIENVVTASTTALALNTWAHAAISNNNGTLTFYINGTQTATSTSSFIKNGYTLGNITSTQLYPFAGFIDDFRIYNRALSASEIAALAGIAPVATIPPTTLESGLRSWLTFDNYTADTQLILAAPTGIPQFSTVSKSGTHCLNCTGTVIGSSESSSLIYSGVSVSLPITVSCWFNASTPSGSYQVILCLGSSSTWGFEPVIINNNMYIDAYVSGANYQIPSIPTSLVANTWYHLTSTISPAGYHVLYLNGVQVASRSVSTGTNLTASGGAAITTLKIGGQIGNTITGFKGFIDDVRIYNRALSPQEVAGLYYSYQPSPYVLYQQPIEGLNVADLAWGTAAAQSATVSAWLKNNTSAAQQFSLSAGNAGAAAAISAITFENGVEDTLGFLTNPVPITTPVYATSAGLYKVGTRALDLTANTSPSGAAVNRVVYNATVNIGAISMSAWVRISNTSSIQCITFFGGSVYASGYSYGLTLNGSGQLYVDYCYTIGGSGTVYLTGTAASSATALVANTWYHICSTVQPGDHSRVYINGIEISGAKVAIPNNAILSSASGGNVNLFIIGGGTGGGNFNTYSYQGYIDDIRIYNRALTAAEVYQIYAKNANATNISQYLLPRSYLYTTPSIAPGAWQRIVFTIPGDSTDSAWAKDTTCGLNLALCLGAASVYAHPSATSGWSSGKYFTGSNIQIYGAAGANFLGNPTNAILLTGVQFERGDVATTFEIRPFGTELGLCMRYFEKTFNLNVPPANGIGKEFGEILWTCPADAGGFGTNNLYTFYNFKILKRVTGSTVTIYNLRANVPNTFTTFAGGAGANTSINYMEWIHENGVMFYLQRANCTLILGGLTANAEL